MVLLRHPLHFKKWWTLLGDLPVCQCYLDDIICYGATKEKHDKCLKAVYQRLENANLKLNLNKRTFAQQSVSYLGHTISAKGLHPSMDHMAAITSAPAPRDVTALCLFLGLTSWLSKFIPNYVTIVDPLRRLLKTASQTSMDWPPEAEDSFQKLKTLLT